MITLSILIASLESRSHLLEELVTHLYSQSSIIADKYGKVEILTEVDNKELTTGAKRQKLLERAAGEYITFIDDDDKVANYYVIEILKALQTKPDCVATNGIIITDNGNPVRWFLAKDNLNDTVFGDGEPYFTRTINHLSPVRKELALKAGFPNKSNGEDSYYSERLKPLLKTETVISRPLYEYRYSTVNKEYK